MITRIDAALVAALAAAEAREARLLDDATRWRRAVAACLPGQTPETAVECVSHLALADAEQEIARLREALKRIETMRVDWSKGPAEQIDNAVEIARAALEPKP